MPQTVSLQGLNGLQRTLISLARQSKAEVRELNLNTGQQIVIDTRQRAPVDLGNLSRNVQFEVINNGFGIAAGVDVPYWAFVEFGTGGLVEVPDGFEDLAAGFKGKGKRTINRAAHPHLIPAYLINSQRYYEDVSAVLDRLFR